MLPHSLIVFKLGELCTAYEKRIKHLHSDATANKTHFKGELLDYFKQIQEQSDGRKVVLIFPKGMKTRMPSHYTSEAAQLASVAKMVCSEMSELLYGPRVDCIDNQSCLTISQLILYS